ncbi:MAG: hypothetical protein KF861_01150 [Planctomycetaceae bacterium]|nr:hypothetical protein [Planctomycetaceae bacterium]
MNRETWLVKLWIDNDQGCYLYWRDRTSQILRDENPDDARQHLAEAVREWMENLRPQLSISAFSDLLTTAIGRVDWYEIADAMIEDSPCRQSSDEVVSTYTRAQAIEDGELIDVSTLAKEAGFRVPVALTAAAWAATVEVPPDASCQDETGRLWDVLNVLRCVCTGQKKSLVDMSVSVLGSGGKHRRVDLKSICGPGDNSEMVITIMLPHED